MPKTPKNKSAAHPDPLLKCPTGIKGFDEITEGGLPRNRTTLIVGGPGSGKTIFGIDFLIHGVTDYDEPGIFLSFEETKEELYKDVASLNLNLQGLVSQNKIAIEHIVLERQDIQERDFNLEGVLMLLEHNIDFIDAKRVVLDSIESLFSGFTNLGILRIEIKRLLLWLKKKQVTAIVTSEPGQGTYTRQGLEEYLTDCMLFLDNRVKEQVAIRRIRVIKYRGSKHGTNEYPFVIDKNGLSVVPITSAGLRQPGTTNKVSSGIPSLDALFNDGKGYTRGSTVLVSGTAGTGKTSLSAAFAVGTCERGERCVFLSYEESAGQLTQNMKSIGIDFGPWIQKGQLKIVATRPSVTGLEQHLLDLYTLLDEFKPGVVIIDPLTSLIGEGDARDVRSMITRMIDRLKADGVTGFFTSLVSTSAQNEPSGEIGVSSLIDTWIVVRELEEDGGRKRIRGLFIVKSRGTGHISDVQKLILSDDGIQIIPMTTEEGSTGIKAGRKEK